MGWAVKQAKGPLLCSESPLNTCKAVTSKTRGPEKEIPSRLHGRGSRFVALEGSYAGGIGGRGRHRTVYSLSAFSGQRSPALTLGGLGGYRFTARMQPPNQRTGVHIAALPPPLCIARFVAKIAGAFAASRWISRMRANCQHRICMLPVVVNYRVKPQPHRGAEEISCLCQRSGQCLQHLLQPADKPTEPPATGPIAHNARINRPDLCPDIS
jgi:hypothetical protein